MLLAIQGAQGLKRWHRDRGRLCSYPVLSPNAYASFTYGPFPQILLLEAHSVLFVVPAQAWGCQAEACRTKGQLHVHQFLFLCRPSVGFHARSNSTFSFPNLVAAESDPQLCILASSSPFLLPHKLSLVLVICSDHPLPSVAGNQEERERYHPRHGQPPFPLLASWVPTNSGICWLKILSAHVYIYMYIYLNTHIYCTK